MSMSGQVNFQGLNGTDFGELITKLKQFESIPKMRMEVWRQEWSMRIDGFNAILDNMRTLQSSLGAFDSMNEMLARTVSSSTPEVATATADSNIPEGIYNIEVLSLARASIFSTKTVFSGKEAKINATGADQTFSYTYKGETHNITVANNTSLEQFVNQINKDMKNPGVTASLVKSGGGYVFQLQGRDTGAVNSLSIESTLPAFDSTPLFTGYSSVLNSGTTDSSFTYSYNGKERTITVTPGMTAGELIDKINTNGGGMGLKAGMEMDGDVSRIIFRDTTTDVDVSAQVGTTSDLTSLGAMKNFGSPTDVINSTGSRQAFQYSYNGKSYTTYVDDGETLQDLVDKINAQNVDSNVPVKASLDSNNQLVLQAVDTPLEGPAPANPGDNPPAKEFTYTDGNGQSHTMTVNGDTMQDFVRQFNNHATGKNMAAKIVENSDGSSRVAIYDTSSGDVELSDSSGRWSTNMVGFTNSFDTDVSGGVSVNTRLEGLGARPGFSGKDLSVNTSDSAQNYTFDFDGGTHTISVAPGTTFEQFVDQVNAYATANSLDLRASARQIGSGFELAWTNAAGESTSGGNPIEEPSNINSGDMVRLRAAQDNYYTTQASDATFKINGWDQVFTSESNRLNEVIEGLDITIKSTGTTDLSVANDTAKLKENIFAVVEAINGLKAQIKELTKYDENKEVSKPEVDEETGLMRMASQMTWQKGSTLTGNYGVQMLNSRFNSLISGKGEGFVPKQNRTDALNDLFSSLSQIGIKTVSDESAEDFGLLQIDDEALDQAIEDDIRNVAELFSAKGETETDSSDFTVASVGLQAKGGVYDVTYDVDPDTLEPVNVRINGALARPDAAYPGRYTVADFDNDAAGLAIQFASTAFDPAGAPYKGSIRVKNGKVNQILEQLKKELVPVPSDEDGETIAGGFEPGALPGLISNYQNVIKSIDAKIERETTRLALWEKRQKDKFSRLETVLSKYYAQMEANADALAEADKNKKQ